MGGFFQQVSSGNGQVWFHFHFSPFIASLFDHIHFHFLPFIVSLLQASQYEQQMYEQQQREAQIYEQQQQQQMQMQM